MRHFLIFLLSCTALAQQSIPFFRRDLERRVHAEMSFLASDEMQGRASATPAEATAAVYLASQFEALGLAPFGDQTGSKRSYIQNAPFGEQQIEKPPILKVGTQIWKHGVEFSVSRLTEPYFNGKLQAWKQGAPITPGTIVFMPASDSDRAKVRDVLTHGAVAVLIGFGDQTRERFERNKPLPKLLDEGQHVNVIYLSADATNAIMAMPASTDISFNAEVKKNERLTRNVIAVLPGKTDESIIISAHFDHIGMKPGQPDPVYNGADDDASGTVAVLEIARAMASGPQPKRTVYFILFGGEELGSVGGNYFQQHPPMPLERVVANVEFEMIGRADPKVAADQLWMTGFDRSDLGPSLAKRGAKLVADPHPEQNFFERSDNYSLAKKGIVAHSVSSFGLHPQYHQPDDDIAHIDFDHMTRAIESMLEPLKWLADSDYKPAWMPGKKP